MRRAMEYLALTEPLEVASTNGGLQFSGYAAVFNVPSEDFGGYRVIVRPGAFTADLKERRDVRMFLNHDDGIVLASTRAGTMTLAEDDKGLLARADLPDNEWGRPVADAVARGDIHTMSIGFKTVRETWSDDHAELYKDRLRLLEVSPITSWAAFPQTTANVYSLADLAGHLAAEPDRLDEAIDRLARGVALDSGQADLLIRAAAELGGVEPPIAKPDPVIAHRHLNALLDLKRRS